MSLHRFECTIRMDVLFVIQGNSFGYFESNIEREHSRFRICNSNIKEITSLKTRVTLCMQDFKVIHSNPSRHRRIQHPIWSTSN